MRLLLVLPVLSTLALVPLQAAGTLFVLVGTDEIRQYRVEAGEIEQEASYGTETFPGLFPIQRIKVERGNVIRCYDQERAEKGRILYDFSSGRLVGYDGNLGHPGDPRGKVLEKPSPYVGRWQRGGQVYADIFVLEERVFGVGGGQVWLLPGSARASGDERGLQTVFSFPGSDLVSAAVSPWREVFLGDLANQRILRLRPHGDQLVSSGEIRMPQLKAPRGLAFSPGGDLFVANGHASNPGVLRLEFSRYRGINTAELTWQDSWRAGLQASLDVEGTALDVALARPVGVLVSERLKPRRRLPGWGRFTQSLFLYPVDSAMRPYDSRKNSEAAILALVEFEPGERKPLHAHDDREQAFFVLAGSADFEIGEVEKEVGTGDLIFAPRHVKHGYIATGEVPFRFLELEWK